MDALDPTVRTDAGVTNEHIEDDRVGDPEGNNEGNKYV